MFCKKSLTLNLSPGVIQSWGNIIMAGLLFSSVEHPRNKKIIIRFVVGNEEAMQIREYEIGDKIYNYNKTDVLVGEYKTSTGTWIKYWISVLEGHIVGVDMFDGKLNKFDIANKYALPNLRIMTKR